MRAWTTAVFDVLFPPACAACGSLGEEPFCRLCRDALLPSEPCSVPGVSLARARFAYGGPVADAVRRLKYGGRPELARPLGAAMRCLVSELLPFDIVVPIPSSDRRRIERGFDPARELVRGLGLRATRGLVRTGDSVPQVGLGQSARQANLRGALRAERSAVVGRRVLMVDDVVTTGSTAAAAAACLRAAGARDVRLLALAQA